MAKNGIGEINYEYIYKNWNDHKKICHLISYDLEILEKDKNEICKSPDFQLTNDIDGSWMVQYKPFGEDSPRSDPNYKSPARSMLSNFGNARMKEMVKNLPKPDSSIGLYVKGNKTIEAKWQWFLKTRNEAQRSSRSPEKTQKFEASGNYSIKGTVGMTTSFDNGKMVFKIKGILIWDSDVYKHLGHGFSHSGLPEHMHCGESNDAITTATKMLSDSHMCSETVIANLTIENAKLKQRNFELENEIRKLRLNQGYGSGKNDEVVTLKAENREFKVSKSTLLTNTEILQDQNVDVVTMNCDAATLEKLVHFWNHGTFTFDHSNNSACIYELLDFVNEYKVNSLKITIEHNLIQNLSRQNIHEFATLAEKYEMKELFHECLVFAKNSLQSSNPISKEGLSKEFKTRLMEMMF